MRMIRLLVLMCCCFLALAVLVQAGEAPVQRVKAKQFAQLPNGVKFPEGITANSRGEIIVGTFYFGGDNNTLLRYNRQGRLLAMKEFGPAPLLGLAYNAADDKIYICNFGMSQIQRIAADFTAITPIESVAVVPRIGPPLDRYVGNPDGTQDTISFGNGFPAPNALALAKNGDLYFSDSFQGAIFMISDPAGCRTNCNASVLVHDPLLATAGTPPFGANGLALSRDEQQLFVANTGDDRVIRVDLNSLETSVFAESINGADGLMMDKSGQLLVAANQADELVALDQSGRVVAKYGESSSLSNPATRQGLLFPASLVRIGKDVYVTNLAFPITEAAGDEPEEDVLVYSISKLRLP